MRYCKECGHHVEFEYGVFTGYCPICDKEVHRKDTMSAHTLNARIAQLKSMHNLMCEANDESIYMTWICWMPDCPSDDDFIFVALNDEQYNECFDLFVKLIAKNGNRY